MAPSGSPFGAQLRDWRRRRRLSQLALSVDAEVSQRHLSFIESGRSRPSRDMVMRLCDRLEVPLRERNALLVSSGHAPAFAERPLSDPDLEAGYRAVELILHGHAPHPALAVDRHWNLISANAALSALIGDAAPELLKPPANVLRLSLHPDGVGPRIVNYREWRAHVLHRLGRLIDVSGDPVLVAVWRELAAYPVPDGARPERLDGTVAHSGIAVPLVLRFGEATLSFLSTTTVFGTALDIQLSEVTIESFFPANPETAEAMRRFGEDGV